MLDQLSLDQAPVGHQPVRETVQATVAFEQLVARFPDLALVDDAPEYRPNPILRGLKELWLATGR